MTWFLRLFPAHAELRVKLAAMDEKCRLLEQRVHQAEARVDDLRRVADAFSRQATGRSVFAGMVDVTPPSVEAPRPITGTRKLGREVQMEGMTAFYRSLLGEDGKVA